MSKRKFLAVIILTLAMAAPAFAAWEKIGADIQVTDEPEYQVFSSLVWTGTEFGVAWSDNRNGHMQIYFTRLDMTGTIIGGDIQISQSYTNVDVPSLVWTGTEYGLSWVEDSTENHQITFARIDAFGVKIGNDIGISSGILCSSYEPSLAWNGTEYGVSWSDNRDGNYGVYFARIDSSGNKIGDDIRISDGGSPSLVWTGTEYGVSWRTYLSGYYDIYFSRIDAFGNKVGGDVLITDQAATDAMRPSLVSTGTEYALSWSDDRDGIAGIYFIRLDAIGNKIGADTEVTNNDPESVSPNLVWTDTGYGVSWRIDGSLFFATLDANGNKIGGNVKITDPITYSRYPSLAWTGTEYGVTWSDNRDPQGDIYFTRIGFNDSPPALDSISPANSYPNNRIYITIVGINTNFTGGVSTVSFSGTGITINSVRVISNLIISVDVTITSAAERTLRDITVTTGSEILTKPEAFLVKTPILSLTSITPNQASTGSTLNVNIVGNNTHFINGVSAVSFSGTGITVNSVTVSNSLSLTANITIAAGAAQSYRDITVTTGSEIAKRYSAFLVSNLAIPMLNPIPMIFLVFAIGALLLWKAFNRNKRRLLV